MHSIEPVALIRRRRDSHLSYGRLSMDCSGKSDFCPMPSVKAGWIVIGGICWLPILSAAMPSPHSSGKRVRRVRYMDITPGAPIRCSKERCLRHCSHGMPRRIGQFKRVATNGRTARCRLSARGAGRFISWATHRPRDAPRSRSMSMACLARTSRRTSMISSWLPLSGRRIGWHTPIPKQQRDPHYPFPGSDAVGICGGTCAD